MTAPSALAPTQARHAWADVARGLGIALVVIGHTLRGLFNSNIIENAGAWAYVDRFIYAFHMPLFFFLSGVFLGSRAQESFRQLAARRLLRLGYPYVIWASLQMVIQALVSRHTNHPASLSDVWTIVFEPPMQFWFLYALLLQSLWLGLLDKLGMKPGLVLALAFVAFVLAPIAPLGPWGILYQARHFMPYTALGLFLGASRVTGLLDRSRMSLTLPALVGFSAVAITAATSVLGDRLIAFVIGFVGTFAALCAAALCSSARSSLGQTVTSILSGWGRASLAVFVAHTIASAATRIVLQRILHISDPLVHMTLGIAAGLLLPLVLLRITERLKFPYLFEWPERRLATDRPLTPQPRA